MTTFQFLTDLNTNVVQELPFPVAIENLYARKAKLGTADPVFSTPIFEWISRTTTTTKFYYDIDMPNNCRIENWNILADLVECFDIGAEKVASICETPSTEKQSFHITLFYAGKREDIKASAKKFGLFLERKYPAFKAEYVDLAVYGQSQKWRCIYSSKRGQNRIKVPLLGDVEEALVTYLPEDYPTLRCSNPVPVVFRGMNLTSRLKWLKAALFEPSLQDLWEAKRSSYESWINVGQTLYCEMREQPQLYAEIVNLYIDFSRNDRNEVEEKFRTAFISAKKPLWNLLLKWVKDHHAPTATRLMTIWNGTADRIIRNFDTNIPTIHVTGEIDTSEEEVQRFSTRTEFIIYHQITNSEQFFRYWQQKLKDGDYSSLELLLTSDKHLRIYRQRMSLAKDVIGDIEDCYKPFGSFQYCFTQFYDWIKAKLDLPEKTDEVAEFDDEAIESAFDLYIGLSRSIDADTTTDALHNSQGIIPLRHREYKNPAETIRSIVNESSLYTMQYPYESFIKELFACCHNDYDLFWLAFSKYSKKWLIAETCFHYISNCPDEGTAAEVIISLYPYWRQSPNGEIYVYDDTEGLWSTKDSIKQAVISRFSSLLMFQPEKGNSFNHALSQSKRENVRKFIETCDSIRSNGSSEFKETQGSGFYKLLFRNGYYDGLQDKFIPRISLSLHGQVEQFFGHFNVVFFSRIDNNYEPLTTEIVTKSEEIAERGYYLMFGHEIGEYIISLYALILMGTAFKGFLEFLGSTNSGKSTHISFLKQSFNGYVSDGQTENFIVKSTDFRAIDRQYAWIVDHWHRRLMMFSEGGDKADVFSSNRMKKIASGRSDIIQASKLRENAEGYEIHFVCAFFLNYNLKWDNPTDPALIDRRNTLTYQKVFVDEVTDPSTQILKDPTITAWETDKKYQLAYNHLIINQWRKLIDQGYQIGKALPKPDELNTLDSSKQAVAPTRTEIMEEVLQWTIITGNDEDYIEVDELRGLAEEKLQQLSQKLIRMLQAFIGENKGELKKVQKRICGVRKYVYVGIKERKTRAQDYSMLADMSQWKLLFQAENGHLCKATIAALERVEGIVQSTGPLNPEERLLIEKWASPTQINYLKENNNFFSNKRQRTDNEH